MKTGGKIFNIIIMTILIIGNSFELIKKIIINPEIEIITTKEIWFIIVPAIILLIILSIVKTKYQEQ